MITPVTQPIRFLGFHLRVKHHPVWGWVSTALIPKARSQILRERIKAVFNQKTCNQPLRRRLSMLNPILRGWAYFYRHAWGAKDVFASIDRYVWLTTRRWLMKKYPHAGRRELFRKHGSRLPHRRSITWSDGNVTAFRASTITIGRFRSAWDVPPSFALTSVESPVRIERRTPGSVEGTPETAG